jgi:hypothetical protein
VFPPAAEQEACNRRARLERLRPAKSTLPSNWDDRTSPGGFTWCRIGKAQSQGLESSSAGTLIETVCRMHSTSPANLEG